MLHAHLLRSLLMTWLIGTSLCACGGGSDSAASSTSSNAPATAAAVFNGVTQSNAQIAALTYSDSQRTPSGFYAESVPTFDGYVATSQLKTQDINASAVLRYELCTDDYQQALAWSNSANALNGANDSLAGTDITSRYFEFDRLHMGSPNGYLRQRVYKCAYLNRNTVDLTTSSGDAGTLNQRPIDAATLQQLSEYLWQFTSYNNFGNVVLSSAGATTSNGLSHSLIMATLTRANNSAACDTINLLEWKHSVDTSSGALTLSVNTIGSFQARESSGNVTLCGG